MSTIIRLFREHALFGIALFLMYTDAFVPPVVLPTVDEQKPDRLAASTRYLTLIWKLSFTQQIALAGALAALWTQCCGAIVGVFVPVRDGNKKNGSESWKILGFIIAICVSLRFWSKKVLADSFTYIISIPHEGQLVTAAPYNLLLHPGYAGVILHIFGIFLVLLEPAARVSATRRLVAYAVVAALTATAFGVMKVRMLDEEEMLAAHFGEKWTHHASTRWRLVPGLY